MAVKKNERRTLYVPFDRMETREEGEKRYITGIIPYDSLSENMGGYREVIRRGAFSKTIQEADIRCLWNHNTQYVCGRNKSGTLFIEERDAGLCFECILPDTTWAEDLYRSIARRDVTGISFGFGVVKERWTFDESRKLDMRELLEIRLFEISVGVAFPAYPAADASVSTRDISDGNEIDFSVVTKVLSLREDKNDYTINDADAGEIRNIIGVLQSLLPEESRGVRESKPAEDVTCEQRERDLALLELEAAE